MVTNHVHIAVATATAAAAGCRALPTLGAQQRVEVINPLCSHRTASARIGSSLELKPHRRHLPVQRWPPLTIKGRNKGLSSSIHRQPLVVADDEARLLFFLLLSFHCSSNNNNLSSARLWWCRVRRRSRRVEATAAAARTNITTAATTATV